jgi:hypothetical protein
VAEEVMRRLAGKEDKRRGKAQVREKGKVKRVPVLALSWQCRQLEWMDGSMYSS